MLRWYGQPTFKWKWIILVHLRHQRIIRWNGAWGNHMYVCIWTRIHHLFLIKKTGITEKPVPHFPILKRINIQNLKLWLPWINKEIEEKIMVYYRDVHLNRSLPSWYTSFFYYNTLLTDVACCFPAYMANNHMLEHEYNFWVTVYI